MCTHKKSIVSAASKNPRNSRSVELIEVFFHWRDFFLFLNFDNSMILFWPLQSILSFITTLVSLLLMVFFLRKCTRIYIHMNLLAAFMLRSLIFLWGQVILGIWHEPKYHYIAKLTQDLLQYQNNLFQGTDFYYFKKFFLHSSIQLEVAQCWNFVCIPILNILSSW